MTAHKKWHNWWIRNYNFDRKHYLPTNRKWNLFTILKSWEITKRLRERERDRKEKDSNFVFKKWAYADLKDGSWWDQIDGRTHSPKQSSRKSQQKKFQGQRWAKRIGWQVNQGCSSLEAVDTGSRRWPEQVPWWLLGTAHIEQLDGPALPCPFGAEQWPAKAPASRKRECGQEAIEEGFPWRGITRSRPERLALPVWLHVPTLLMLSEVRTQ